ncbi:MULTISPECIES: hypothetical protein [unclassified Acidovorax]|nr:MULTISPECIES: hypothetical protein [unclassified Acidovorax]
MQDHIDRYRQLGFLETPTDSGTGSCILVNLKQRRVVKFNQDPAYDKFVEFIRSNPDAAFPEIFLHEKPLGEFRPLSNDEYTVTEIEQLVPLSGEEQQAVLKWVKAEFSWLQSGAQPRESVDDPLGLGPAFHILLNEAKRVNVCLDVEKGSNFMKRAMESGSRVVFTDPYN